LTISARWSQPVRGSEPLVASLPAAAAAPAHVVAVVMPPCAVTQKSYAPTSATVAVDVEVVPGCQREARRDREVRERHTAVGGCGRRRQRDVGEKSVPW